MRKKNILRIVYGILLLIAAMLVLRTCSKIYFDILDSGITNIPEKDYKNIFLEKYRIKLIHLITYTNKVRPSISMFNFNGTHDIIIFKRPLSKSAPTKLSEIIRVKLQKSDRNSVSYQVLDQRNFELAQSHEEWHEISKIFLKFNGHNLKTIVRNDSLISYSGEFYDFSLEYKLDGICDIYAERGIEGGARSPKAVPVNLLFYQKGNFIYFVILSALDPNGKLEDDVLHNLVVEKLR